MRGVWVAALVLACVVMATEARADTVYLKDGRSFWGTEAYEEGDTVVVVRPGGSLTFPKAQVNRIERLRSTLPPFYSPPSPSTPGQAGTPGIPTPPGPATPLAPPGIPGGSPTPPAPPGGTSVPTLPGPGPTQLPPPPPPPPPGGYPVPR